MKKILYIILAFSFAGIANAQWEVVAQLPQSDTLNCVQMISATTAWAVGENGTIIKTTDGGASWVEQNSGITNNLNGVYFTDENNGVAVGDSGIIRTTDSGISWNAPVMTDTSVNFLYKVSFADANIGIAVGHLGRMVRTTDGGANWTTLNVSFFNSIRDVTFIDANIGAAVGLFGIIYRTEDGGATWVRQTSGTTSQFRGVSFLDAENGIVVGSRVIGTTDGGSNWSELLSSVFFSVSYPNANSATAVGSRGKIYKTTDGGANWESQISGTDATLTSVSFIDADNGIAVGYDGAIVRTSNGGVTAVNNEGEEIPVSFSLLQNYPNPFNPSTTIKFSTPQTSDASLVVFNALGQKVASLLNERMNAGNHSVNFNAEGLSSGVYFYRLTAGSFKSVKKLTYLK